MRITVDSVVAFDLDDTLYLERDYALSGFRAVSRWLHRRKHWPISTAEWFRSQCVKLFEEGHRGDIFDRALQSCEQENKRDDFRHVGRGASAREPALIEQMVRQYRSHQPEIDLKADALQLLTALKCMGVPVWIITDGPLNSQQQKVRALNLRRWTDHILFTDTWGRRFWKPHPRAFARVQAYADSLAARCWYIADNPDKDFQTPQRMGWSTIRIRRAGGLHASKRNSLFNPPDATYDDLSAIVVALEYSLAADGQR